MPEKITELESNSLKVEEQMNIIREVKEFLPDYCLKKLENCLKKNPDLEAFNSEKKDLEFRCKTQYAPLVSCDVERSFSNYKDILTDK